MDVVSFSVLALAEPSRTCPWLPATAVWAQAGAGSAGRAGYPDGDGRWWSVLARWRSDAEADEAQVEADRLAGTDRGGEAWHVRLAPAAYRGDAVLDGGVTPFADLPDSGPVAGPAGIVTFAGLGPDPARLREFLERFAVLSEDLPTAAGNLASGTLTPTAGPVLTFSVWTSLRAAMAWAYSGELHAATIARQEEAAIVETAGFLRCAVTGSRGTLLGRDPLAALATGRVAA